jgi:hypothetical protein
MTPSADLGAAPRAEAEDLIGPAGRELVTEDDSPLPQAVGYVSTLVAYFRAHRTVERVGRSSIRA